MKIYRMEYSDATLTIYGSGLLGYLNITTPTPDSHHWQDRLAMSSTDPFANFQALRMQGEGVLVLNIHSNWVSGVVALVFDILFLSIIRYHSELLCASTNLALIYDWRHPIRPVTSRLGALTGGPTGPIILVRLLSILGLISTAAVVVIGFCINGETVAIFEPETYGAVINFTGAPLDIDYPNEFKFQPKDCSGKECRVLVSKRFLALSDPDRCVIKNVSHVILYSLGYKNLTLDGEKEELNQKHGGATCLSDREFNESRVFRSYRMGGFSSVANCRFKNITDPFGPDDGTDDPKQAVFEQDKCDFETQDMRCYKTNVTACAGWGKIDQDGATSYFIVLLPDIEEMREEVGKISSVVAKGDLARVVSNVAYFSAIGFRTRVHRLAYMAVSDVLSNVTLQRKTGTKNISTIDLNIAVPAFAIIATTTVLLALVALISWTYIVLLKGRRNYNTFCSVPEILALAGEEKISKLGDLKSSRKVIGISQKGAHLLICDEKVREECTGSEWLEEEIL